MKEKTMYEADNGKVFDNIDECIKYESENEKELYYRFSDALGDADYLHPTCDDVYQDGKDDCMILIRIKDKEQAIRFSKWCKLHWYHISEEDLDTLIGCCLCVDVSEEKAGSIDTVVYVYNCMTIDEKINTITNGLTRWWDILNHLTLEEN